MHHRARNAPLADVTRVSGIDVATDRFVSVSGPPCTAMPHWGLTKRSVDVEYHLHPPITFELHYQVPFYIVVHTFNGATGRLGVGNAPLSSWTAEARGSCLIPPNVAVRIVQDSPLEYLALGIQSTRFDRLAGAAAPGWGGMEDIYKTGDPALAALSAEIRRSMIAEPLAPGDYLDALTDTLLTRLITWHLVPSSEEAASAEALSPATARRVARTIDESLGGSIRVAGLADAVGLSRAHFSRAFATTFGMAPSPYIMSRRIARARSLLVDTTVPITEVARVCGFASPSHLTNAFRKELGVTPSAYRQALSPADR